MSEESGIIKIIFYVQNKGLLHPVEIQLGEAGKSLLQSKIDNIKAGNALESTAQIEETNQPLEIGAQTYENTNYSTMNMNSYDQQTYYSPPIITPIEGKTTTDSNYNIYQTNGDTGLYEGGVQIDNGFGYIGDNVENIGSYNFSQYDATNASSGFENMNLLQDQFLISKTISPDEYNTNSYEYLTNQYSTSDNNYNNYFPTNYGSSYQTIGTSYENNSYNYPISYTDTTNQYTQSAFEETVFNQQQYQTYENTASVKSINNNVLPTITPAEPIESNEYNQSNQYEVSTTPIETTDLHLPLDEGDNAQFKANTNIASNSQLGQEMNSQTAVITKLTDINDNNQYLNQQTTKSITQSNSITPQKNIETSQKKSDSPKNIIDEIELQKLKKQAAESVTLKAKLAELEPLKKKVEEMEEMKKELIELNTLREQAAELNSVKSQLEELNELRQQVGQMNILRKQLDELNILRSQVAMTESLKKRIEELEKIKLEYEQEIKKLREGQKLTQLESIIKSNSNAMNKGLENKKKTLDEKAEQVCIEGEIIHDSNELEMIATKINKSNKKLTLNLLYKATADTDKAVDFHAKCDDAKSTIVLVETDKGKRFGGYTSCSWSGDCLDKKDENAFVFSLDRMKTYDNIPGEEAIGCYPKFGPIFLGCQIRIYDNAFSKGGSTFEKGLNYDTEEDFELTDGDRFFNVKEIEVYEVIRQ